MSFRPTLEEQDLLADTLRRADSAPPSRELLCEAAVSLGFVGSIVALWVAQPPHGVQLLPTALCLLVLVLATKVRFDTPFGFTVATQLGFVPLVFALRAPLVPIAVLAALLLARLPDVLSGTVPARRLVRTLGNASFALGPPAVFVIAGTSPASAGPGLLVAALSAQLVLDFAVSGIRTWIERGAGLRAQLRDCWVYAIDIALSGIALVVGEDIHRAPLVALAPLPLLALLAMFARERRDRIESLLELNTAYRGTALALGDLISADDNYTGEHTWGVVKLTVTLAEALGLDSEQRRNLEFAALLHDVGKITVPKEIINKPGKLTPEEWAVIETHTIEGQKMLDRIGGFMQRVGVIVRSHHERWDGTGYPDGLAGEAIPVEARIIACCDAWNAMRTDRAYRSALSAEDARSEMLANAGRQFDPGLTRVFLALIDEATLERAIEQNGTARHLTAAA